MPVKLSTFGQTEENIATLGQQQNQADNSQQNNDSQNQDTQNDNSAQASSTNNADQQQQNQNDQQQQDQSQQEQDFSISTFTLGGDDADQQQQGQNDQQQQQQSQPQPQFNLDEELKKIDRKELAKKLGFTDFAIEINDHIATGGSAIDYLNAKAIDYTQISDENIIKDSLRKQYPTFTPSQIDLYYTRKYGVSEEAADDEKEFATLQLKADAHTLRQQLVEKQKQFKIPEAITPVKDEAYEQWKQNSAAQAQIVEQINGFYQNHAATKALHENKKVAINVAEGVAPFNITIDRPELITKSFTDGGETWQKLTSTQQGEPDVLKQQKIAIFSFNPDKFCQDLFNYGVQQGKRSLVAEGQNARKPETKILPMNPDQKPTYGVGTFGSKPR